jgi:hypothetical protein
MDFIRAFIAVNSGIKHGNKATTYLPINKRQKIRAGNQFRET